MPRKGVFLPREEPARGGLLEDGLLYEEDSVPLLENPDGVRLGNWTLFLEKLPRSLLSSGERRILLCLFLLEKQVKVSVLMRVEERRAKEEEEEED